MTTLPLTSRTIGQTELAKLANVSQKTVSRALSDGVGVNDRTRQRIQRLAAQHQYRPNAAARSTRQGRFGAIALLLGTKAGRSTLPATLLNGIHDALVEYDLNLIVVRLTDERLTDDQYVPRILRETSSDGLLIDYTHGIPPRMLELIETSRLPAVWINSKQPHDCVHPDDLAAARDATGYLLGMGHRRVAYADFSYGPDYPDPHYSAADRRQGYLDAMAEAGLQPRLINAEKGYDVTGVERKLTAARILAAADRPTAVVCLSATTMAAFYHAAQDLCFQLPRDLSLVSFDDAPLVTLAPMPATQIVPHAQVGRQAVKMLQMKVKGPNRRFPPVAIPFDFESCASCARVTSPESGFPPED